jgi:class 3 adenylate cyclase
VAVTTALRPYVPDVAAEWLAGDPDQRHRSVEGTLAFVDISGFTALARRLTRQGTVGSEELSDILDVTFGALLAHARREGGDLVKWGGDAVLLLFTGEDHAIRAVRASADMRSELRTVGRTSSSAGGVSLRMSVGVHSGRFDFFLVGDPQIHRELVISGPAASRCAEMEVLAKAGQIMLSEATAALLPPGLAGEAVGEGRLLRRRPPDGGVVRRPRRRR